MIMVRCMSAARLLGFRLIFKAVADAYAIHSKSWSRWSPDSTDNLEFSAERLSENAKTINSAIS